MSVLDDQKPVVIIGAGLAGLQCAYELSQQKIPWVLLEAHDKPGGRIKTRIKDGFQIDEGFQVFLTAYKTASENLDLNSLELKTFLPGALVAFNNCLSWLGDPLRLPAMALKTLFSPLLTFKDKLLMLKLKYALSKKPIEAIWNSTSQRTVDYLYSFGFSSNAINHFFIPFFSGIFLEPQLETSSRLFEFVFKHFSIGSAALPKNGMQAIPLQLASRLDSNHIRYNTIAKSIASGAAPVVHLSSGERIEALHVVIATDNVSANHLLPDIALKQFNSVNTLYFSAPKSPLKHRSLLLFSRKNPGLVNHLCVPSDIQPSYAPINKSLVCVSTFEKLSPDTETLILEQLKTLFGNQVNQWHLLESVSTPYALPQYDILNTQPNITGITIAGDYCESPSIEGAIVSAHNAAKKVIALYKKL